MKTNFTIIYLFAFPLVFSISGCDEAPANDAIEKLESVENAEIEAAEKKAQAEAKAQAEKEAAEKKAQEQADAEMEMEMYEELERLEAFECQYCGEKACEGDCQQ